MLGRCIGLVLVVASLGVGGCAIQQLNDDIASKQASVAGKQDELAALERNQAALGVQRDQLLADLAKHEFDVAQLKRRLEHMSRLNDATPGATPEQHRQREERTRKLVSTANKAKALEQDQTLPQREKAKRLEALKEETRKMLSLLLVG